MKHPVRLLVAVLLSFTGPLLADDAGNLVLLFHGPARFEAEAKRVNGMAYGGRAELFEALPAQDILLEIERRGRDGKKIAAVEILGHGLPLGPFITGESPRDSSDRLTVDRLQTWAAGLRKGGIEPRGFFAPGAVFTIRACYVGKGKLPKALLDILPPDGKVISDYEFYKNTAVAGVTGGMWSRQRVTAHGSDFVYKKGNDGESEPWDTLREGQGQGIFPGTWVGEAKVTQSDMRNDHLPRSKDWGDDATKMSIRPGAFVIRKLDSGELELTYQGNLLTGTSEGSGCVLVPVEGKGGNMKGASLKVNGDMLTGTLIAENNEVYMIRELTLTRVK